MSLVKPRSRTDTWAALRAMFWSIESRAAGPIVWSGWLVMVVLATRLVGQYGLPLPWADEWSLVEVATDQTEPDIAWLWSLHNEHRLPVPKLVYLAVGRATGFDYPLMAQVNVLVLAAISGVWVVALRRMRGRTSLIDLAAPALFLHFGHEINLTWRFNFCLTGALATSALLMIAAAPQPLGMRRAGLLAMTIVLLAGCGTTGIIYAAPLAIWLGLCGAAHGFHWRGGLLALLAVLLLAMCAAYVLSFPASHNSTLRSTGLIETLDGACAFAVTAWGPVGRGARPLGAVLMAMLLTVAGWLLARAARQGQHSRATLAGLTLFVAAGVLLALLVSQARAGGGIDHLRQTRYGIHALPLLCGVLLICERLASASLRRQIVVAAVVLIPVIVAVNDRKGLVDARDRRASLAEVEQQIALGAPATEVAAAWGGYLQCHPWALAVRLDWLNRHELGPYADLPRERAAVEVAQERDIERR